MKILIAGAGIAGLTAAYWLDHHGFEPVIVEKAPSIDPHGFLLGIRGPSITVLRNMGALDAALDRSIDTFPYRILSSKGAPINTGRYLSYKEDVRGKLPINRADLEAVLYEAIRGRVEVRFATTIGAIAQDADGVDVQFSDGSSGRFDLLVGADGVHSAVRQMVFGAGFEQMQPATYAAFISAKSGEPVESFVQFAKGMMSVVYDLSADTFGGIAVIRGSDLMDVPPSGRRSALIARHESANTPITDALRRLDPAAPIYADAMMQVIMPRWHEGRVVLVGDAAYCLTAASGFGATAALIGAYVLPQELAAHGLAGLASYDARLRSGIAKRQKTAAMTTGQIVSENPMAIGVRDLLLKLVPDTGVYKMKKLDAFGITEDAPTLVPQAAMQTG
jgi:2-polyprenyl-6-methoxyphenol hydroxylase-like FAD-dependent oxidoreductase